MTDARGGALRAATVTLVGHDGHEVAVAAVDEDGTFHLAPQEAGTFQLVTRAEGHRPEVGWVAVPAAGEVVRDVALGGPEPPAAVPD